MAHVVQPNPAVQAQPAAPVQERSYIKDAIVAIYDFVVGLFRKIASWFSKEAPVDPQQDLYNRVQTYGDRIEADFKTLYPDRHERNNVYFALGSPPREGWLSRPLEDEEIRRSRIANGLGIATEHPELLLPYLQRKIAPPRPPVE